MLEKERSQERLQCFGLSSLVLVPLLGKLGKEQSFTREIKDSVMAL